MSGDSAKIQNDMGEKLSATGPGHLKLCKPEFLVEEMKTGEESFGEYGGVNDSSVMFDMEGNQGEPFFFILLMTTLSIFR